MRTGRRTALSPRRSSALTPSSSMSHSPSGVYSSNSEKSYGRSGRRLGVDSSPGSNLLILDSLRSISSIWSAISASSAGVALSMSRDISSISSCRFSNSSWCRLSRDSTWSSVPSLIISTVRVSPPGTSGAGGSSANRRFALISSSAPRSRPRCRSSSESTADSLESGRRSGGW